jgi:hypothetical protein
MKLASAYIPRNICRDALQALTPPFLPKSRDVLYQDYVTGTRLVRRLTTKYLERVWVQDILKCRLECSVMVIKMEDRSKQSAMV